MARAVNRLSARTVVTIGRPGRHADGNGLYLVVDASGAKRWLYMFRWGGKLKEMGLGGLASISLADARARADEARKVLASGLNPIEVRRERDARETTDRTFGAFADRLIPELAAGFRSAKHAGEWTKSLNAHAATLRPKQLDEIDTADVLAVLKPIWVKKHTTASRVRGRIERVLDAAKAERLRSGENPARWRGHLDHLLSKRKQVAKDHHAAMAFTAVPGFVADLRERGSVPALALEFLILTTARYGEVGRAKWSEIDMAAKVWTVPATRMKAGLEHRVPLTDRAVEILQTLKPLRGPNDFVFPGRRRGGSLHSHVSNNGLSVVLRSMGVKDATVHGFRSSFRDWAGETTSFPREIAEACLAHVVGDETERAYRRGDALARRRKLLDAWAGYVGKGRSTSIGNVVEMRRA